MSPLIENPEKLMGKFIPPEQVGRRVFNALARSGFYNREHDGLDAYALAQLELWQIQGYSRWRKGERFTGLGEKGMGKIIHAVKQMAGEGST